MNQERYMVNGIPFPTYDKALEYCELNGFRVTHTYTVKKVVYLLTVTNIPA